MSPKEKAIELAKKSTGEVFPDAVREGYQSIPFTFYKRDGMILAVKITNKNKKLTDEDRQWWKEVLILTSASIRPIINCRECFDGRN